MSGFGLLEECREWLEVGGFLPPIFFRYQLPSNAAVDNFISVAPSTRHVAANHGPVLMEPMRLPLDDNCPRVGRGSD